MTERTGPLVLMTRMTVVLLLPACSSPEAQEAESASTVEHVYGATAIPSQVDRFATVGWASSEAALALGKVPAGMPKATWGGEGGLMPWTREAIEKLDDETPTLYDEQAGDTLNFEAILDVDPDVIVAANSGITEQEYKQLTDIAPTVAYKKAAWGTPWRDVVTMTASALAIPDEGTRLVTELEQTIENATEKYPQINGMTTAFSYTADGDLNKFGFYSPSDTRLDYLRELGFVNAPSIEQSYGDNPDFTISVSPELATKFSDIDVLVTYGDEALLERLQAHPTFGKIPAIARGSVVLLPDMSDEANAAEPNALTIQWGVEQYAERLAAAADLAKADTAP